MRKRAKFGMTLLELLLVAGIVSVMAASSAPFLTRIIGWYHDIVTSEVAISRIYDTGMVVSRAITQDSAMLASFTVSGTTLYFDGKPLQEGVSATFANGPNNSVLFRITSVASPSETLRFVILPIQ